MNSKQFLQIGGGVLVLVGVLGFIGVLGPTADRSIFGETWFFDNVENWAHLIIGVVGLIAAYTLGAAHQKMLTQAVGAFALLVAVYNLFGTNLGGAALQRPLDFILHLVVGVWALWASMQKSA